MVPEYLDAVGLLESAESLSIRRAPGRNSVFAVRRDGTREMDLYVKQFGPGDFEGMSFERECAVVSSMTSGLVLPPSHIDSEWRLIVTPSGGQSLLDLARSEEAIPAAVGASLVEGLGQLEHVSEDATVLIPPLLRWLDGGEPPSDMPMAQRRLIAALSHEDVVQDVCVRVRELWGGEHLVFCHGDLKLEHVVVSAPPTWACRLIDWEYSRQGPRWWDHAGLVQSSLAIVVLGLAPWTPDIRSVVVGCLRDVATGGEDFAALTAFRMWQTALEWETGRHDASDRTGPLCQLGINLFRAPNAIEQLLVADG